MAGFKALYDREVKQKMMKRFSYKNIHQVPKIEKIIVNCCTKDCVSNSKVVGSVMDNLGTITGQKPVVVKAKKSIAAFKVRSGMPLGAMVTLRGKKMYEFLERLVHIVLPRVRDFRGINPKGLDGRGNYNLGLKELIVFAEIDYDKLDKVRGLNISIVTTGKNDEEGLELLTLLGMPFAQKG